MKNVTRIFLNSAPVRTRLPFGVNSPVVLKAISNAERRDKNNLKIERSCYMRFAKLSSEDPTKIVAETEFSYFGLTKKEYAPQNFIHQYQQMMEVVKFVIPASGMAEAKKIITAAVMTDVPTMVETKKLKTSNKSPNASLHNKMKTLLNTVADAFAEALTPYTGIDGHKLNLLVVTGPNGKFLDLPKEEVGFINSADSKTPLRIDGKYHIWYARRNEDEKADGDVMGEELNLEGDELDLGGSDELDLGGDNKKEEMVSEEVVLEADEDMLEGM